jgi:hypothetical protein
MTTRPGSGCWSAESLRTNVDWQTILSVGALAIAGLSLADRIFGKALTRTEHQEFKDSVLTENRDMKARIGRLESKAMKVDQVLGGK